MLQMRSPMDLRAQLIHQVRAAAGLSPILVWLAISWLCPEQCQSWSLTPVCAYCGSCWPGWGVTPPYR